MKTLGLIALLSSALLAQDPDRDGLPASAEAFWRTDPARADTDRDGAPDGLEVALRSHPLDPASRPVLGVGAAVSAWAEGEAIWLTFTVASPSGFSGFRRAEARAATTAGVVDVTALVLTGRVAAADGIVSLTLPIPRALVGAGSLTLALRYEEAGGGRGHQVVLSEGPSGLVAGLPSGDRMQLRAAEGRSLQAPPIPRPWEGPGLPDPDRICEQRMRREAGPVHRVTSEECRDKMWESCVWDCGSMIGHQVVILDGYF